MFPVFVRRFALPEHWQASTQSIGLGSDKGMWESRVVREGGFANVITELKYGSKFGLCLMGALMPIMTIGVFFTSSDLFTTFAIIPVDLGLGFPLRIRGSFAHDSAVGQARQLFKLKA
ncbi:MAG: hypothetical protein CMK09_01485 [Ponticaulis sp.]|nr:hypothetical protein [Ponticaulis sp.]